MIHDTPTKCTSNLTAGGLTCTS